MTRPLFHRAVTVRERFLSSDRVAPVRNRSSSSNRAAPVRKRFFTIRQSRTVLGPVVLDKHDTGPQTV